MSLSLVSETCGARHDAEEAILLKDIECAARQEALEASSHGLTVEEYKEFLADLQEDAGLQG